MTLCGYCGMTMDKPEATVTVGNEVIALCHDREMSCYELVTVHGRPLMDGRRVGRHAGVWLQLEIPYFLPGDEAVVEMCGCKWVPGAHHMIGCPVPAKMDPR